MVEHTTLVEQYSYINNLPGLLNIKDLNSRFLATSGQLAKLLGWGSSSDPVGKSDFDTPCGVAEFACEFVEMDNQVINLGKKMLAIDIQNYSNGWGMILAEKNPIKNDDNSIVGILSALIDITEVPLFNFYFKLYQFDAKWLGKRITPASYILSELYCPISLTEKQENCIFLLVRGKSIKQVAKILNISPRTVECHLDAIKTKLHAGSKSEIIEKSIDKGFLFYVPKYFQNSCTSKTLVENV